MTAPPNPIARLRDVVEHQPNFRGSRNDLLFLLDTITELQDDSDVESVRHALQTSEARVDRLTAELEELRNAVTSTLTEPHAVVALAQAHRQDSETADELEAKVDRLMAALRAYGQHRPECASTEFVGLQGNIGLQTLEPIRLNCDCGLAAALAPADPETKP